MNQHNARSLRHRVPGILGALSVTALSAFVAPAHAGGPAFSRLYGAADDAVTVFTNPAGMTRLEGTQIVAQGILARSYSQFIPDDNLTTVAGGKPRDADPMLIPAVYYVRPLGEDWRLGLSLNIPSGFGSSNGPDWSGRYFSDEFSLVFVGFDAELAYRVNDWLSVGGGLTAMYSASKDSTPVNPLDPNAKDAQVKLEATGAGVGFNASVLIELSERTRFGIAWSGEVEPDEDVDVNLQDSGLPEPIIRDINRAGDDIDAKIRVPQHVGIGGYHEWDNGWSATLDATWVEFSRFGITELSVVDVDLKVPESEFNDFWIFTAGVAFPISDRLEGRVGALYVEQPVDDDVRTFSFALDEAYGAGAGIHYERPNGDAIDLNLSVLNTGDAPIDTGVAPSLDGRGRVAGENDHPYAFALEFVYHWR